MTVVAWVSEDWEELAWQLYRRRWASLAEVQAALKVQGWRVPLDRIAEARNVRAGHELAAHERRRSPAGVR